MFQVLTPLDVVAIAIAASGAPNTTGSTNIGVRPNLEHCYILSLAFFEFFYSNISTNSQKSI